MTPRQFEILKFLYYYISEHGYSPSYKEIQIGANINSYNSVSQCINSLLRRGFIEKEHCAKRSTRVTKRGKEEINISNTIASDPIESDQITSKTQINYTNKFNNMILEYTKVERKEAEFEKSVNLFISKFNRFIKTNHFNETFLINGYSDLYKFKELASLLGGETNFKPLSVYQRKSWSI
mgnify:CR=1 FL=1